MTPTVQEDSPTLARRFFPPWPVRVLIVILLAILVIRLMNQQSKFASEPNGPTTLAPCPASPNCVCSLSTGEQHAIEPLRPNGDLEQTWQRLQEVVAQMPRTQLAERHDDYLRYEFRSRWLGFVDDVEFLLDRPQQVIQVRSASRKGYSDLGVNRKRVEEIRRELAKVT